MPKGGRRPNAGAKLGSKHKATITKELAREMLRELVKDHLAAMTQAQIANAMGLKYLVTRDAKTGKFVKVTESMLKAAEAGGDELIGVEVWEKDPSVQAFTDLLNRTLDKPGEHVELTGRDGGPLVVKWQS